MLILGNFLTSPLERYTMKFTLNLLILTIAIPATHLMAMDKQPPSAVGKTPGDKQAKKTVCLRDLKSKLFQKALNSKANDTDPLVLGQIRNMQHVLEIARKDAENKLEELEHQFSLLNKLANLETYTTPGVAYSIQNDPIKKNLLPIQIADCRAKMDSSIRAFADYMAIQELALKQISKRYAKELKEEAPAIQRQRILD